MKSSVEKLSETRVKLTVEVPFEELTPEIDKAYQDIAQQVTLPGFRRGKAPRRLIDARFGRGPILEQVVNDMLPDRYEKAVQDNELSVLTQPKVEITKLEDNDVVEFTAEVDVRPEITVPDFSDISVTVAPLSVSEEEVDKDIERLRDRFGELKDTERELQDNDFATIDLTSTSEGEEENTSEDLNYRVGSESIIDGLDDALRGLKAGEEADFTTDAEGKEISSHVVVKSTKERVLPEVDEDFVQMASEFDTVEELREDTRQRLTEYKKTTQAAEIRDKVLAEALDRTDFEIPQGVVDDQFHAQIHQIAGSLAHDDSQLNAILSAQGKTREEFDNQVREEAEKAVRTQLFLDALADEEKAEISQEELTEHILYTARAYGMEPQEFMARAQSTGEMISLFADVRRGKALAAAILRASVTDEDGNDVDTAEYFRDDAASDEEDAETTSSEDVEADANDASDTAEVADADKGDEGSEE